VSAKGIKRIDGHRLSLYLFQHILFQRYLYNSLDEVERTHLHEEVGNVLEMLYGERADEISVQLARHFQEAGITAKAVKYLYKAGSKAVRMSANEEAIAHFLKGLELLKTLTETPESAQQELELQLALGATLQATKGYGSPEVGQALNRSLELAQQIADIDQLFNTQLVLTNFYAISGDLQNARQFGEQLQSLAKQADDPTLAEVANFVLGWILPHLGEFSPGQIYLQKVIEFYDPQKHRMWTFILGHDLGVASLVWDAVALWFLGYPVQALKRSQEAIALAKKLGHPFSLAFALGVAGCWVNSLCREFGILKKYTEKLIRVSTEQGFAFYQATELIWRGIIQYEQGNVEEGIALALQGKEAWQATGTKLYSTFHLSWLAEGFMKLGKAEEGLKAISEAFAAMEETGERYFEAELNRIKGELLLMLGESEPVVEEYYRCAIEVAHRQKAKSLELRAVMSLSRLLHKQSKKTKARKLLKEIYGWFTEGFNIADLKEAKALLEELSN